MEKEKEERSFEESMKRLEEIIARLENPELSLEEGMSLYKEGAQCARNCREKLEKAQHELEIWQNGSGAPADLGSFVNDDIDINNIPF